MSSNEEVIRNLYAVAEKEPTRFRSPFTENGYWWDVPAGVKYRGDEVARAADIYSAAFPDMHRELSDLIVATLNRQGHRFSVKQVPTEVFATLFPGASEVAGTFRYFQAHTYLVPIRTSELRSQTE